MRVARPSAGSRHGARSHTPGAGTRRIARALAILSAISLPSAASAQVIHGTVSSAVGAGRVRGAVVLLVDSSLTTFARALTSDSGTFSIGAGAPGRFHLKVMRIGFRPTESLGFDLRRDTTIDVALADIPVILPAVTTRDRNDCRLHPDTTEAGLLTFALWDQARTAILAAAITLEGHDYRFAKLLHLRVYDVKQHALRDIALRETETRGATPWTSLPAEQLRHDGYVAQDDSGMTFYAPDLDVLLSPYFTEEHCFHLATATPPDSTLVGIDFEPAERPRHVEIRGTLWLDAASKELRSLGFTFVNLPVSADTLIGGHVDFARLTTGGWILPGWSIRMPTPVRSGVTRLYPSDFGARTVISSHGRWRLSTDFIRVAGGDVRAVRRGDLDETILWRRPTGSARVRALAAGDTGQAAAGAIIRLAGSPYGGNADMRGRVRFEQVMPGTYLFEASTPLLDALDVGADRAAVTVRAGEVAEGVVKLKDLGSAAAEACKVHELDHDTGVLAGHVLLGDDPVAKVRVSLEWIGGDPSMESRDDGYFRFCGVPIGKLILVRASRDRLMVTTTVTLAPGEIVRPLELRLQP
jgi:hypothetical protein